MRILTGRRAQPAATPRRRRGAPLALVLVAAMLATITGPTGMQPAAAAGDGPGPEWMPFTGPAQLWCSWGNPSPGGFCSNYHSYPALDVGMGRNTPIHAAGPGVVQESGNGCAEGNYNCFGGRGNFVAIRHADGRWSRYLHLTTALVTPGTTVVAGQRIGYSGATGSVCRGSAPCPHLHYDELDDYTTNHHVDPGPMLARHGNDVVTYPHVTGAGSWPATSYGTELRNDGFDLPPADAARFRPVAPSRVLDSRTTTGGWNHALEAGQPRELQVGGSAGVPTTATAVVLNVTATGASGSSYLTVYPAGVPTPQASNLNYDAGPAIPNLVTVRMANGGRVAFANGSGWVDVVADVVGYYDSGAADAFGPLTPTRILDSRDGTGGWPGRLAAGQDRSLAARGLHGVPNTATAVVLNVTATHPTHDGFVRVYPSGGAAPSTSNLNFSVGQTIANLVVAPIGPDGRVNFGTLAGTVDVVADITGYFAPTAAEGRLHAISPTRVLDGRIGLGATGPWSEKTPRTVQVTGTAGIPAHATAVVVNVTVTNPTAASYLTVYPDAGARPLASNLGFSGGQTIPNLVMVRVGAAGTVQIYNNSGSVDVVADVVGYFTVA